MVYERRLRAPEIVSEDMIAWQWSKASRALDALEAQWIEFLSGTISAGHISVGCALGYLDFRHNDRSWRVARPGLTEWLNTFGTRPSMKATVPTD